ncbi:MAG: hypothetical protein COA58_13190 [Bacteroidetes bacterium]|nr:MAG: hypothetical protein COA58_13190 [Bacteroidota bacterium]
MRNALIALMVIVGFGSCKKELVDASTNDIADISSLEGFKADIKEGTTVVFFFAVWCEVCEEFRPTVESVSTHSDVSEANFLEVEYEDNRDIFKEFGVSSFPQLIVYKNGTEQEKLIGKNHTQEEVINTIKKYL